MSHGQHHLSKKIACYGDFFFLGFSCYTDVGVFLKINDRVHGFTNN